MRHLLLALLLVLSPAAQAAPLKVVASFSILGDFAAAVGGDDIALTVLVRPGGDPHAYQPRPGDAAALAQADLVLINGFGFEGWIDRLVAASGYGGPVVGAAEHAVRPPARGATDPHAWHDAARAQAYVRRIAAALAAADPQRAARFRQRAAAYLVELAALDAEIRDMMQAIPPQRRHIVTAHASFGYFALAYDIDVRAPQGIGAAAEPSAKAVAGLIRQIRAQDITAVFVESVRSPRLIEQIARETGAVVAGPLYADSLSAADGPAASYLAMMRHNARLIAAAMAGRAP